jgi:hypothetical protein
MGSLFALIGFILIVVLVLAVTLPSAVVYNALIGGLGSLRHKIQTKRVNRS